MSKPLTLSEAQRQLHWLFTELDNVADVYDHDGVACMPNDALFILSQFEDKFGDAWREQPDDTSEAHKVQETASDD